jgi:hypothetical protein
MPVVAMTHRWPTPASPTVSLEEARPDIVCLHVLDPAPALPPHRFITCELADAARRALVNSAQVTPWTGTPRWPSCAGRLHAASTSGPATHIEAALLEATTVATPHVAGYSDDGKRRGTLMVYAAFCAWAGLTPVAPPAPPGAAPVLRIEAGEDALTRAFDAACFVRRHDVAMRELIGLSPQQRARQFDGLRRDYPPRRDFQAWRVQCADLESARLCHHLGFTATAAT